MQLLQVPFMGLEEGDEIRVEEEIIVAASADVSSVTDIIFAEAPIVRGRVETGGRPARVHIDLSDGTPFTQTTVGANGRFEARVPPGNYRLRVLSPAAEPVLQNVTVGQNGAQVLALRLQVGAHCFAARPRYAVGISGVWAARPIRILRMT